MGLCPSNNLMLWSKITVDAYSGIKTIIEKLTQMQPLQQINKNPSQLETMIVKLEEVNKKLSSYLQRKRMSFSRFFFLADEELL